MTESKEVSKKVIYDERLEEVCVAIANSPTKRSEVVSQIKDRYSLEKTAAYDMYNTAVEIVHEDIRHSGDRLKYIRESYNRLITLYEKCINKGSLYNALQVELAIMKLLGLEAPMKAKLDITSGEKPVTLLGGLSVKANDSTEQDTRP